MEYPDDSLYAQGMANVENADEDWPDFGCNWDTLTDAPTSVPATVWGEPSIHTASSAASATGATAESESAPAAMEVDAEAQPLNPNRRERHKSHRSVLIERGSRSSA